MNGFEMEKQVLGRLARDRLPRLAKLLGGDFVVSSVAIANVAAKFYFL